MNLYNSKNSSIEIAKITNFNGPSIYAQCPIVRVTFGALEQASKPDFLAALFTRLPGLANHSSSCEAPNCFGNVGENQSLINSHLFEHVCIELQNLAGAELSCLRTNKANRFSLSSAVIPYEDAAVCLEAAQLAIDLFASLTTFVAFANKSERPTFDFETRLKNFATFARREMLPVQDRHLIKQARALDIPVTRLVGRMITLGYGRFQQRMSATKTSHTNIVSNDIAANKDYSRRILTDLGLPVPQYERVYRRQEAIAAAKRIGYPVVVKPNNGSMGSGVSVRMNNRSEVKAAYNRARQFDRSVLVEEMVEGADYRMLVIDGKLCAASKRVPGHVVGDGVHTIEELVNRLNSDPRRGTGPTSSWTRIEFDDQADRLITELEYTRSSIPKEFETVYLRRNANTSDGGTAVDITDDVHPDNRDIAERAAKAIGLDIAGVDFLTQDISSSMWKNGGRICEINSRPGMRKHIWPAEGKPRDVMTPIINMLFPPDKPTRVPTIAITGTGNTGTAAQMLAHILASGGYHVGLAIENRVYSAGRLVSNDLLSPAAAARMVLLDPDVNVAIFAIAPDEILRHGLSCDAFNVTAIISADGGKDKNGSVSGSAEIIEAIRVVARSTRDVVYACGEDELLVAAVESDHGAAAMCRVVSTDGQRAEGVLSGDQHQAVEGDAILSRDRSRLRVQPPMAELLELLPDMDYSDVAQSALYASLSACSIGETPEDIYRSLCSYSPLIK